MEWKNALSQHSARLDLNIHGWRITDESIEIRWMDHKRAPDILDELTSCCCKKKANIETKCASVRLQNSCVQTFVVVLNAKAGRGWRDNR